MLRLPSRFAGIIIAFAPLFVQRSWKHAQVLLIGALLTPGQRTVASLQRLARKFQELAHLSANAAAAELNRQNVATPRGGKWTARTVLNVRARLA